MINRRIIRKWFIVSAIASLCGSVSFSQTNVDTDGDYLSDADETNVYHTDIHIPDTDADGQTDWQEVYDGTDPLNPANKATWAIIADRPYTGGGEAASRTGGNRMQTESSEPTLSVWNDNGTWYFAITDGDPNLLYDLSGTANIVGPWTWMGKIRMGAQYRLIDPNQAMFFYRVDNPVDTDSDGLTDVYEREVTGTPINNPDADGDGLSDGVEVQISSNPLNAYSLDPAHTHKDGEWFLIAYTGQSGERATVTLDTVNSYYDPGADVTHMIFNVSGLVAQDQRHVYISVPSIDSNDPNPVWEDLYPYTIDLGFDAGSGIHDYEVLLGGNQLGAGWNFAALDGQDRDLDGLQDGYEIVTTHTIVGTPDSDQNGTSDDDEAPSQDSISNIRKWQYGLNPQFATSSQDSVGNGMPDWFRNYVTLWYGAGAADPWTDADGDQLPNIVEYEVGSDPTIADYWHYFPPPPGDESKQHVSLQVSSTYTANDGPNNNPYFPTFGTTGGPLGGGVAMTVQTSGTGAGTATLNYEIWPLDLAYDAYAPFTDTADPDQGELQKPDEADGEVYRELLFKGTHLAGHVWAEIEPDVLEALSSKTLEYVHATSMLKIQYEVRTIQYLEALETAGVSQPGLLIRIQEAESSIHTEITKITAIDIQYVKKFPNLDWIGHSLHAAGFFACAASWYYNWDNLMAAINGYKSDVRNHTDTAGPALLSTTVQSMLQEMPGLPNWFVIGLDPTVPIFDPNPLGWYDGGQ